MHCARSYHRGAIKKRLSRTVNEAKLGHLRSAIERSHDRTIPRYAGTEPSGGRSIPLSPHLRPNRLKPSTIESITCDDNTLDSTRFNDDIVDDHLLLFLPFLSFPKGTLSISPLIRSHRGKTRFGHICATITLPDSMLEITSFPRWTTISSSFQLLTPFQSSSLQFSSFSFPSSCRENSVRAYLYDDNILDSTETTS